MKQEKKLKTATTISYAVVSLLLIVFVIYMSLAEHNSVYQARTIEPYTVVENYTAASVEDDAAPAGLYKEYRWKLSDISATRNYLAFYIVHHYAEVRIDGELVYSLMPDENNRIGFSPSSNWVFVPLYVTDNGREIQVTLTPVYKSVVNRQTEFLIGTRYDILRRYVKADLPQIVLSMLCIFMGVVLMLVQPFLVLHRKSTSRALFYLGNALLFIGVWRMTDTRTSPILFPGNPMALGYITIAALVICCVPSMLFIQEGFVGRRRALLQATALMGCIVTLIALACQVLGIEELRETLKLAHVMLLICVAVVLLVSLVRRERQPKDHGLRYLALPMCAGAILDLTLYYWRRSSSGILFTMAALLLYTVVRFVSEFFTINRRVYIDAATGLYNRNQWNEMTENPRQDSGKTGVFMLDLNRLKYINDTMGHEMGDKMILGFSNALRKVFPGDCKIFRWGGDEFTVLVPDADRNKMEDYLSDISAAVDVHNALGEKPEIYYAVGYALSTDYPTHSLEELLKKADEKMYHNKSQWYQKNVPEQQNIDD